MATVFTNAATPNTNAPDAPVQVPPYNSGACPLSCGLRMFQGWAEGVGIRGRNEVNFEKNMTTMLYLSKMWHENFHKSGFKMPVEVWNRSGKKDLGLDGFLSRISIPNNQFQFLQPNQNNLISAEVAWIKRFEDFVVKHSLGSFTKTAKFLNPNYLGHIIQVAVWTWNGALPKEPEWLAKLEAGKAIVTY